MNDSQVLSPVAVAGELERMLGWLTTVPAVVSDDALRIDVIAGLERLKAAVAAAQARTVEAFAASQETAGRAMGLDQRAARRGVPEQVGLARRVSPATASKQVAAAKALVRQLPRVLKLLERGQISEFVATIVVAETSVLAAADRRLADQRIAARCAGVGPKAAQAIARQVVIELDQPAVVAKAAHARTDRRVSCRPAPDTMAVLSALLPCHDGVRAYAALRKHADQLSATGDQRSRDQIMADTLVERLTGQTPATGGPVQIGLIMTDASLFTGAPTPAELTGYGPIPAPVARDIIHHAAHSAGQNDTGDQPCPVADTSQPATAKTANAPSTANTANAPNAPNTGKAGEGRAERRNAQAWIRRLYTDPTTGMITNVDPRKRRFTGTLATYLLYRDRYCRTPYCQAPIRHLDHIDPRAAGGPTTPVNGRGLCERCNYINQLPGWTAKIIDPERHIVETTTPTGHTYRSHPPPPPGST
ncbi:MAG TPA: DUF222 domain-containing protein [Jiangellaceae bacterium]|nr:DUF222 domain-containing protein [Jiangellaceae bacterium]